MARRFLLLLTLAATLVATGCATSDACRSRHPADLRLEPFHRGDLKYPTAVRGIRGSVSLHVRVDRAGVVTRAVPVASQPAGPFDAAAVAYVSKWRYCPRASKEKNFPDPMLVEIEFRPAK